MNKSSSHRRQSVYKPHTRGEEKRRQRNIKDILTQSRTNTLGLKAQGSSMKWLIIAAVSLAVVSCASLPEDDVEQQFQAWKLQFGKVYETPEEEAKRKDIWLAHRSVVLAHNARADQGTETFHMGMNKFSDLTDDEIMKNANHMLRPGVSRI
ncbi:hypothetical protein AALO_G00001650 [Alosa alosa]|uniref:Cathepsin propeptide inhibitor domain-containing protein n=2 Tax=Alosa alosa TaxID=278164 RepID=A0AAV6HD38_9TELE|nr:hypothetical protein AALO_G00001650 [Alosa alosa]